MLKKMTLAATLLSLLAGCGTVSTGVSSGLETSMTSNAAKKNASAIGAFVSKALKKIDASGDGKLTYDEYMRSVAPDNNAGAIGQVMQITGWLSMGALSHQKTFEVPALDNPADLIPMGKAQVISVADFNKAIGSSFFQNSVQKCLSSEFENRDKNGNKLLEKGEMSAADYKDLLKYDTNKDGAMNLVEFLDGALLSLVTSTGSEGAGLAQLAMLATVQP